MFRKKGLNGAIQSIIAASVSASLAGTAAAQLEEVIVTATKREESMQDVSVAVSALTSENLDQLGVTTFTDYLVQLPGVTAGGSGPGQNTVYIRGVASTTPNLTTAGVAGLAPNVAFYLDEQPLAQPGRNLDVYAADMERVEVLSGPQGTLFGASSQAGTVRLITNKPDFESTYGRVKVGVSSMTDGGNNNQVEAMLNLSVNDSLAIRGVAYRDDKGGFIDNVQGTVTALESARFRAAGTIRSNGEPVSQRRAGMQTASAIAGINQLQDAIVANDPDITSRPFIYEAQRVPIDPSDPTTYDQITFATADNSALVGDDINTSLYEGFRLSALANIGDDWSLLSAFGTQDLETDGVFSADPTLGTSKPAIQRYQDEHLKDSFDNFSMKLEGRIGELEVVYAGSYTTRDTDQRVDYTDYLYTAQYLPYYICDSTVSYPEYNYGGYLSTTRSDYAQYVPRGACNAPDTYATIMNALDVTTHEVRISTDQDKAVRVTAGAFFSDTELRERVNFRYPGHVGTYQWNVCTGGVDCPTNYAYEDGYASRDPFAPDELFRNDIMRTDEQTGFFGELTYDLNDSFSATIGARYYSVEVDMVGSANGSFSNFAWGTDNQKFGTNISDLYDGDGSFTFIGDSNPATTITVDSSSTYESVYTQLSEVDAYSIGRGLVVSAPNAISPNEVQGIINAVTAPDKAETDGTIVKLTLNYTPNENVLIYGTYSEGFRPGILNRPGGASTSSGYTVPFEVQTDEVKNLELGWKADIADGSMRINGNFFVVDVTDMQTSIFDPSISNLFFADNAADAEIVGLETDLLWAPQNFEGLTISAAVSFLSTEITNVLIPTDDVQVGDELAFAPEFQGNLQARYEWDLDTGMIAHIMPYLSHSAESYSDIIRMNRDKIESWTLAGITAGVSSDGWSAELFVDNLFDERAELARNYVFDRPRVSYARPRTVGLRMIKNF